MRGGRWRDRDGAPGRGRQGREKCIALTHRARLRVFVFLLTLSPLLSVSLFMNSLRECRFANINQRSCNEIRSSDRSLDLAFVGSHAVDVISIMNGGLRERDAGGGALPASALTYCL